MHDEPLAECLERNKRVEVLLTQDVNYIKISVTKIETMLKEDFVKKSEFEPIRKIVYGMVGIILTAVVLAVIALVIK